MKLNLRLSSIQKLTQNTSVLTVKRKTSECKTLRNSIGVNLQDLGLDKELLYSI